MGALSGTRGPGMSGSHGIMREVRGWGRGGLCSKAAGPQPSASPLTRPEALGRQTGQIKVGGMRHYNILELVRT